MQYTFVICRFDGGSVQMGDTGETGPAATSDKIHSTSRFIPQDIRIQHKGIYLGDCKIVNLNSWNTEVLLSYYIPCYIPAYKVWGMYTVFRLSVILSLHHSDFVYAQYLENKSMESDQILHML